MRRPSESVAYRIGQVDWFRNEGDYGVICLDEPVDGCGEAFVHHSALKCSPYTLHEGVLVTLRVIGSRRRPGSKDAADVELLEVERRPELLAVAARSSLSSARDQSNRRVVEVSADWSEIELLAYLDADGPPLLPATPIAGLSEGTVLLWRRRRIAYGVRLAAENGEGLSDQSWMHDWTCSADLLREALDAVPEERLALGSRCAELPADIQRGLAPRAGSPEDMAQLAPWLAPEAVEAMARWPESVQRNAVDELVTRLLDSNTSIICRMEEQLEGLPVPLVEALSSRRGPNWDVVVTKRAIDRAGGAAAQYCTPKAGFPLSLSMAINVARAQHGLVPLSKQPWLAEASEDELLTLSRALAEATDPPPIMGDHCRDLPHPARQVLFQYAQQPGELLLFDDLWTTADLPRLLQRFDDAEADELDCFAAAICERALTAVDGLLQDPASQTSSAFGAIVRRVSREWTVESLEAFLRAGGSSGDVRTPETSSSVQRMLNIARLRDAGLNLSHETVPIGRPMRLKDPFDQSWYQRHGERLRSDEPDEAVERDAAFSLAWGDDGDPFGEAAERADVVVRTQGRSCGAEGASVGSFDWRLVAQDPGEVHVALDQVGRHGHELAWHLYGLIRNDQTAWRQQCVYPACFYVWLCCAHVVRGQPECPEWLRDLLPSLRKQTDQHAAVLAVRALSGNLDRAPEVLHDELREVLAAELALQTLTEGSGRAVLSDRFLRCDHILPQCEVHSGHRPHALTHCEGVSWQPPVERGEEPQSPVCWCRNRRCDRTQAVEPLTTEGRWSLLGLLDSLGFRLRPDQLGRRIGEINRWNEIRPRLFCAECGGQLEIEPRFARDPGRAAYAVTVWRCLMPGCGQFQEPVKITHCNGCGEVIDSRFDQQSELCGNHYNLCMLCGTCCQRVDKKSKAPNDCGLVPGVVCPKCGEWPMEPEETGGWAPLEYTCRACGHAIDVVRKRREEYWQRRDSALQWLERQSGQARRQPRSRRLAGPLWHTDEGPPDEYYERMARDFESSSPPDEDLSF